MWVMRSGMIHPYMKNVRSTRNILTGPAIVLLMYGPDRSPEEVLTFKAGVELDRQAPALYWIRDREFDRSNHGRQ